MANVIHLKIRKSELKAVRWKTISFKCDILYVLLKLVINKRFDTGSLSTIHQKNMLGNFSSTPRKIRSLLHLY